MDVFNLVASLTLDTKEYDSGLGDAEKSAHSFGGRFSKVMKVGAAAAAGLGIAAGFIGKKLVDGAKDVAAYGDRVDKMSQKIGISAEAYQKWNYVMKLSDVNIDSLKMGMKTLSQQAEKNSDAFQKLGISQEEVQSLSQEELFERTIKGLSDMEAGTERTALASKLLGRAGADMAPLLNQGSEAIEEQMEIAEKYGMVIPDATVKASAAFQDSMTTMQMTAQGLKNRLLGEFLPAMTQVTDGMAKLFTGDMSGLDDIIAGIEGFIGKIGEMAPKVFEAGGKLAVELGKGLIKRIPDIISAGGQMLGKLLEGMQKAMSGAGSTITAIINAIVQFVTTNAPLMIQAAITLAIALAQGLIQAIPTIIASIPQIISGIVEAITGFNWVSVGKSVLSLLARGMRAAGGLLKGAITKPISAVKSAISSGFNAAKQKAVSYMQALKDGVTKKINSAKDAVKKVVNKIKNFFPVSVGKIFSGWIPKISLKTNKSGDSASTSSSVSHTRFAKAANQPYLFTRPTVFNQDIAGETTDEMLYGKSSLMKDITTAVDNSDVGGQMVTIYNYITVNGAEKPEEFAGRLARQMKLDMRTA